MPSNALSRLVLPQQAEEIEFVPPTGAKRWRGMVDVSQEVSGVLSIVPRAKFFLGQARMGFPNGVWWPTGKIRDGGLVMTPEIEGK